MTSIEFTQLSYQQQDMLANMNAYPECASKYDLLFIFHLSGNLDILALALAINQVTARHGALRTTIGRAGDNWIQHVHGDIVAPVAVYGCDLPIPVLVSTLTSARHGRDEILDGAPLSRPQIMTLDDGTTVLAWTIHHLVADGESMAIIWRDLTECYAALREKRPANLPHLSRTYGAFAARQQAAWPELSTKVRSFWSKRLSAYRGPIAWPASPSDPEYGPYAISRLPLALPEPSRTAISQASRTLHTTPFLVILTATAHAITEVSKQNVLLLGTDTANREDLYKENMVGHFVNTTHVLAEVDSAEGFGVLAGKIRDAWLDAEEIRDAYSRKVLELMGVTETIRINMTHIRPDQTLVPVFPEVELTVLPIQIRSDDWRDLTIFWNFDGKHTAGILQFRRAAIDLSLAEALAGRIEEILWDPLRHIPVFAS